MKLAVFVLFAHFLADFVFQSDSMAQKKSTSWVWLMVHVGTYTTVLWLAIIWAGIGGFLTLKFTSLVWLVGNGLTHFLVDAVTSRVNRRLWSEKRVHAFFVGVGADQFIHSATLLLSLGLLR